MAAADEVEASTVEGADSMAAEVDAPPAEVAPAEVARRTAGGWVREKGVPRAAASSGLLPNPSTKQPPLSSSVTSEVGSAWINRSRARERSAATFAFSSALACWAEKGWSERGT
eukprot:6194057-Pleurochrysis_carterae.AAC.2